MKISYRRLFFGLALLLLLSLVLFAGRFALKNFTGTGPIPTRSAFAGRLPSIDEDRQLFRFYYTTNRADNDETFKGRGNAFGESLLTGTFDTRISPYLPIAPFAWFDEKSMELKSRDALPEEQFWTRLREDVQASPKKSLLFIVWGFRDWFQSAALKTAYTAYVLDINTPTLLFDWPGNQGEGRRGYQATQLVVPRAAEDLGQVLAQVMRETGAENVWLMGSSLGCQVICDSFKWLAKKPELFYGKPKLSHVILSAPDVAADAFDEQFSGDVRMLSRHLTAYVSSNDRALLMSHWLNGGRRLGRKAQVLVPPEDRSSEYEFEEALELLELKAQGGREIDIVDASPINVTRNLHHFFTDSPVFFDDLYQRLQQPDDIVSRRLHSVRMRSNMEYWILWND